MIETGPWSFFNIATASGWTRKRFVAASKLISSVAPPPFAIRSGYTDLAALGILDTGF
jgi:hypothetical protein